MTDRLGLIRICRKMVLLVIICLLAGGCSIFFQNRLTDSADKGAPLEMVVQAGHTMPLKTVMFSPDGNYYMTAAYNDTSIRLYSRNGKLLRVFHGYSGSLAFTGDSRGFVYADVKNSITIKDLYGNPVNMFDAGEVSVQHVAVSNDNSIVTTSNENGSGIMTLWDFSGNRLNRIEMPEGESISTCPVFSPDGSDVAVGLDSGSLLIWSVRGKLKHTVSSHSHPVKTIAYSPDGKQIATGAAEERARLWTSDGEPVLVFGNPENQGVPWWGDILSVSFSPDGQSLITSGRTGQIRLWGTDGRLIRVIARHVSESAVFSPVDPVIAADAPVNSFFIYDSYGNLLNSFQGINKFCDSVFTLNDGRVITTAVREPVRIWGAAGALIKKLGKETRYSDTFALSPDETILAGVDSDKGLVSVWNLSGPMTDQFSIGSGETITDTAFSPDGKRIAIVGYDKQLRLFTSDGRQLFSRRLDAWGYAVTFSLDGKYIATGTRYYGDRKSTLTLWSSHGKKIRQFPEFNEVRSLKFTPDSRYIVSGTSSINDGFNTGVRVWDISGDIFHSFSCGSTLSVDVKRDGTLIAAGGYDDTVYIWNIDGTLVQELKGHENAITSVAFLKTGNSIVTGGADTTLRYWNVDTGQSASVTARGNDWAMFTPDGYFDSSRDGGGLVAIVKGLTGYGIHQFAALKNRPDLILERLGSAGPEPVRYFNGLHRKRLSRMGLPEDGNSFSLNVPVSEITDTEISEKQAQIRFRLSDSTLPLIRYNVYVNDVPVFGESGKMVNGKEYEGNATVELTTGSNRIEITCFNSSGAESLRAVTFAEYNTLTKGDLYFVGFGVSDYLDSSLDLKYAAKDISDLADMFRAQSGRYYRNVYVKKLLDRQVTPESVRLARQFLLQAKTDDTCVLALAGYGMYSTDDDPGYYFFTSNTSMYTIPATSVPFEQVEALLQGIEPRNKLLLKDTCESGEVDTTEIHISGKPEIRARYASGLKQKRGDTPPRPYLRERNRYIHNDLFGRSGAIIFSSSRGNEFSYESDDVQNGLFTEGIRKCLRDPIADRDNDGYISIRELQLYVTEYILKESDGHQNPVIIRGNFSQNFGFGLSW